jgi:HEXXH motif-containing protein
LTTHTLPPGLLESISGPGSAAEIDILWSGQYSRRLVQLRTILDLVSDLAPDAGKRAHLQDNFAALATVQRHAPDVVAALLSGPQAGAWAARCLRLLAGARSAAPLWFHLAHLGSIATAAGIRSATGIEAHVPLRSGILCLPTLGQALTDQTAPWILATCTPSTPFVVNGSSPREWHPLRLLETTAFSIPLDDTDPYWTCFNLPLARLTGSGLHRWRHQLTDAVQILAERHPDWLTTVAAAVRCLVPVEASSRIGGVSASSRDAPGAVALTEPLGPDRLASTLIHEVQHYRLNAVHDLVPLFRATKGELLYSPWRNDPRSRAGLLHGTAAFLGVAEFWHREWPIAGSGAALTYARMIRQLRAGHRSLSHGPDLTPAGTTLVDALHAAIDRLPETDLPSGIRRIADDLVAHHRALWRLHNVVPDSVDVARLADEWQHRMPITVLAEPDDRATTTAAPGGDSPLFRLALAWAEGPDDVQAYATDLKAFSARHPGADAADLPLLAGDYPAAQTIRLGQAGGGAVDAGTWASLSVAHGRVCADPPRSLLVTRPELVRAAWTRLSSETSHDSSRDLLAELISRYIAGTSTSDSMRR